MNGIKILVINDIQEVECNNQPKGVKGEMVERRKRRPNTEHKATCELPRNYFVIDRITNDNVSLPPPPKHFKYI